MTPSDMKLRVSILRLIDDVKALYNESKLYIDYVHGEGRSTTITQARLDAFLPDPEPLVQVSAARTLPELRDAIREYLGGLDQGVRNRLRRQNALNDMNDSRCYNERPLGPVAEAFLKAYQRIALGEGLYVVDLYDLDDAVLQTDDSREACSFAKVLAPATVLVKVPSKQFPQGELHEYASY